ncbi:MAG: TRAP transporter large permease subunit [Alphaproteobacteria bacterium]|nr:TRAP transporter large permease subunit [Alphaproteobacteria bacterium]MDX5368061.1 TRAP transporter large permease subunit [Alphaproteobacteria bacterium]MDX5462903.1 TRAP transporter large permease subunit [Alphaproteobacteria bacterium]
MNLDLLVLVLIGGLAFLLLIGQWTAFALGSIGTLIIFLSKGVSGLEVLSSVIWNNTASYILVAVPLFLLMGDLILRSGVSRYFYRSVVVLLRWLPGGLLHANILSCAIFSAVSGSSVATAATVGTVAIPEMRRRQYAPRMIFGSLAAGGTLGILIPPSIVMILYGALVEESIAQLFMAGLIPGIALAGIFMAYIAVRIWLNPSLAPEGAAREELDADPEEEPDWRDALHVLPICGLLGAVLGSIYTGVATPTEAGAIGVAGALLLGIGYRGLDWEVFRGAVMSSVRTTCMVVFIIVGAQILATALTYSGASRAISEWVLALGLSKWMFFAMLVLLYVGLGFFVDGLSMIYMTLPVLLPLVRTFGFDLVWFGVVLTILIELGQITPPVGLNLFTIHGISGGSRFSEVVRGAAPYVALMLAMILLLALFPGLALWLPATMMG